ncbi:uncharacterized protein LOC135220176 [Macrobrachium nipponense]|uniref:uncharacterized protein LOC135220176 n=1 Tax=Macrobrachium nipponense TaxID=159736 RepID=UPI0030C7BA0B
MLGLLHCVKTFALFLLLVRICKYIRQEASDHEKGVGKREIRSPRLAEVTDEEVVNKRRQTSIAKRKHPILTSSDDSSEDDRSQPKPHLPYHSEEIGPFDGPTAAPSTQSSQRFDLSVGPTTSTTPSREIAEDSPSRGSTLSFGSSVTGSMSQQSHKPTGTNRTSSRRLDFVNNQH